MVRMFWEHCTGSMPCLALQPVNCQAVAHQPLPLLQSLDAKLHKLVHKGVLDKSSRLASSICIALQWTDLPHQSIPAIP
jgi:hypothetical protein